MRDEARLRVSFGKDGGGVLRECVSRLGRDRVGSQEVVAVKQRPRTDFVIARRTDDRDQHAPSARVGVGEKFLEYVQAARIGLHERLDRTATNQPVVPTEVVIEYGAKRKRLAGWQSIQRLLSRFGFETAA